MVGLMDRKFRCRSTLGWFKIFFFFLRSLAMSCGKLIANLWERCTTWESQWLGFFRIFTTLQGPQYPFLSSFMEPNGILISSLASLMSLSQHCQLHLLASYTFNRDGVTESFVGRLNSEQRKQLLPLGSTVYERFNSNVIWSRVGGRYKWWRVTRKVAEKQGMIILGS